jgi:hypothetical protein
LSALSTAQMLSKLKTEMKKTTEGEGQDDVDKVVEMFELEAGRGALKTTAVDARLRESMKGLLIKNKISQILEVETAGEAQQRAFFVSVLECSGLDHRDDEEVYVKVMCAGESRETDAVKHSSGHPVWRHGAGQTVAFIDVQQKGVTPGTESRCPALLIRKRLLISSCFYPLMSVQLATCSGLEPSQ